MLDVEMFETKIYVSLFICVTFIIIIKKYVL
jgi:hypothetical protein